MPERGEFIAPTDVWASQDFSMELVCPECGFNYTHILDVTVHPGNDDYTPGPNRGGQHILWLQGECGHEWQLVFGFHKGNTYVMSRLTPEMPRSARLWERLA